ncbi:PucR family transcriptional regulator [Jongsikchunia kroppenstedtii]|uniref:PucR family transcriptional regulator n=1 Tax=Jongsikchunia kroppenstedtii TaxID=1121721 RepID=UPI000365749F|nr:PucR family transcriptional regulator [Jongsikchunia kroppenstedtii]
MDEISRIADLLAERLDGLAPQVAAAIQRDVDFYSTSTAVPLEQVADTVRANIDFIVDGMRNSEFDTAMAAATGSSRAETGVPLVAVVHAYRIGFHMVWREFRELAEEHPEISREGLLRATELMWEAQDNYIGAMSSAHRERATQQVLDDAAERAALTEHLLQGRLSTEQSLWEVAELLRLPTRGPYLAVTARASAIGRQPLPGIESKLRGIDVYSAWRLLPDEQIGIVHAPSPGTQDAVIELLRRQATTRVGVSAPFAELQDTAQSLRFARIAQAGPGEGVTVFDDSVLGLAATGSPEISAEVATSVLGRMYRLPDEDRKPLFTTFRAWVGHDGNAADTAGALFVHPNTVRHRLRRIEELTGRSITKPRELAELCLAFEVDSRFQRAAQRAAPPPE